MRSTLNAIALAAVVSAGSMGIARAEPVTAGTLAIGAAKAAVVDSVRRNFEGANRETSTVDKLVKATTGISAKDMRKHGFWGGPNSFFRKPFG